MSAQSGERYGSIAYVPPALGVVPAKELVAIGGPDDGSRFVFYDQLQIGRLEPDARPIPGALGILDPVVSLKHCVITQDAGGRCFVRDVSLNGTRIENRRLVPGAEVEIEVGQVLSVGQGHEFRLEGQAAEKPAMPGGGTLPLSNPTLVTVLVGDIRGYTTLVREVPAELLQPSVSVLFQRMERLVAEHDGTVKEYPGDAILAYWEASAAENCGVRACRAALALDAAARRLAADDSVWRLPMPLRMDWALSTGHVMISSRGGSHPMGLSMIGEAVVMAFRIEKLADDEVGSILLCGRTRSFAGASFRFLPLGPRSLSGFPTGTEIFALLEAL